MFETNDSHFSQQHSALESFALRSHMNAPVNIRQHEVSPASINPCKLIANLGVNEFGIPCSLEKGLTLGSIDLVKTSIVYPPTPHGTLHHRKFLIFDQSHNETRVMFSSIRPRVQTMPAMQIVCPLSNPQLPSPKLIDDHHVLPERQAEQVSAKENDFFEGSGEKENLEEECAMREDTEEINALLYSDDCDDQDDDFNDENDDEVSSGHSPLTQKGVCHIQDARRELDFDDEVAIPSIYSKRRKTLDGGKEKHVLMDTTITPKENIACENICSDDPSNATEKDSSPTIGNKRPRKDKIRDTLKVLESMIPGLKSKDPVVILDEAISYLRHLKCNAETMLDEDDSEDSTCCEPIN